MQLVSQVPPQQPVIHAVIRLLEINKAAVHVAPASCRPLCIGEMPYNEGSLGGATVPLEAELLISHMLVLPGPDVCHCRQHTCVQSVQHTGDGNWAVVVGV